MERKDPVNIPWIVIMTSTEKGKKSTKYKINKKMTKVPMMCGKINEVCTM